MENQVKYYFVLASQKFLLIEEPLEEVLRERVEYYRSINKPVDFWLLPNPTFLEASEFKKIKNSCLGNTLAIVSTNRTFITWLKLRIQNVSTGEFDAPSSTITSPLSYNKLK